MTVRGVKQAYQNRRKLEEVFEVVEGHNLGEECTRTPWFMTDSVARVAQEGHWLNVHMPCRHLRYSAVAIRGALLDKAGLSGEGTAVNAIGDNKFCRHDVVGAVLGEVATPAAHTIPPIGEEEDGDGERRCC